MEATRTTDWTSFRRAFQHDWKAGQHVSIIGSTGSGKSYLALRLLLLREYFILFLAKANDATLTSFLASHKIDKIPRWPPDDPFARRYALWPTFRGVDSFASQATVFREAINGNRKAKVKGVFAEGGWTVYIDEVMYFVDQLRLEKELEMLWTQGRSNNLSLVACSQRPRAIPQLMLDQWSHLFVFGTSDQYELRRLREIGGTAAAIVQREVPKLQRHSFLYVNRAGDALISRARGE